MLMPSYKSGVSKSQSFSDHSGEKNHIFLSCVASPLRKKKKEKRNPLTLKIALCLLPPRQIHIITFPCSGVIINVPPERGFVIPSELPINFLDSSDEAVNLS